MNKYYGLERVDELKEKGNPYICVTELLRDENWKDLTPQEINNGNCDAFAEELLELCGGVMWETGLNSDYPSHLFVECGEKFYDAECPDGVYKWENLPIYQEHPVIEIEIEAQDINIFERKFKRFRSAAEKLGVLTPTWEKIKELNVPEEQPARSFGRKLIHKFVIQVDYELPIINGWQVIGNREMIGNTIYTKTKTGDDCTSFHRSNKVGCDHCQTKRYRKKSVLLKNEKTGSIIEVGNTCLKDFFGHSPATLGWIWNGFEILESESGGDRVWMLPLEQVLVFTSHYVAKFGFMPSKFEGYTTKGRVIDCFVEAKYRHVDFVAPETTEANEKEAAEILDYFRNLDPEDHYSNEYMTNLIKISGEEYAEWKLMGYVVSMVSTYHKIKQRKADFEKQQKDVLNSEHQGIAGQRLRDILVELRTHRSYENMYGISHILIFKDEDGNVYKTKYSGTKPLPEEGDYCLLTGTVKEHAEWKEIKQTVLTRIILQMFCPDIKDERVPVTHSHCASHCTKRNKPTCVYFL